MVPRLNRDALSAQSSSDPKRQVKALCNITKIISIICDIDKLTRYNFTTYIFFERYNCRLSLFMVRECGRLWSHGNARQPVNTGDPWNIPHSTFPQGKKNIIYNIII